MKKYKGAVFFDYDGTLTDKDEKIYAPTAKTAEAVRRLQQNGYAACLATGRSKKYIPQLNINFDCVITTNGGCTIHKDKILGERTFNDSKIRDLVNYFNLSDMIYVLERPEKCFVNLPNDSLFNHMIGLFSVNPNVFTPLNEHIPENVHKILLIYRNHEQLKDLKEKFSHDVNITSPEMRLTTCDINPKGVSKADGVKDVCQYFDIPLNNTYAFGDGENDYTMLRSVENGIAMLNHNPKLNSVASYITDSVKDEGIYKGLVHFGLIEPF